MTQEKDAREGGAWIGQHPDPNTQEVRDNLDGGAERVAVTNNESGAPSDDEAPTSTDDPSRRADEDE
jgi:hypothetical protein